MNDSVFIQHRFTIEKDGLVLSDAIVLPQTEYQTLTNQQIIDLKNQRFENYKQAIENPVQEPEPTKEEKVASIDQQLASLEEQKQALTLQKESLQIKGGK